jgi:hypothetical protein
MTAIIFAILGFLAICFVGSALILRSIPREVWLEPESELDLARAELLRSVAVPPDEHVGVPVAKDGGLAEAVGRLSRQDFVAEVVKNRLDAGEAAWAKVRFGKEDVLVNLDEVARQADAAGATGCRLEPEPTDAMLEQLRGDALLARATEKLRKVRR